MIDVLLVVSAIFCAENPIVPNAEAVITDYVGQPFNFEGTPFPDKGDIMVIECDVTQDGRNDILISGSKLLTDLPLRWTSWRIYKGEATGGYRQLMYGMAFDPSEVFLYEDEAGDSHLATLTPPGKEGVSLIKALELVDDSHVSPDAYGTVGVNSQEGRAWIEERMEESKDLVQRIPAEEVARKYMSEASSSDTSPGEEESNEDSRAEAETGNADEPHESSSPVGEETLPPSDDETDTATPPLQAPEGEAEVPADAEPIAVDAPYSRILVSAMGLLAILLAVIGAAWYGKR